MIADAPVIIQNRRRRHGFEREKDVKELLGIVVDMIKWIVFGWWWRLLLWEGMWRNNTKSFYQFFSWIHVPFINSKIILNMKHSKNRNIIKQWSRIVDFIFFSSIECFYLTLSKLRQRGYFSSSLGSLADMRGWPGWEAAWCPYYPNATALPTPDILLVLGEC